MIPFENDYPNLPKLRECIRFVSDADRAELRQSLNSAADEEVVHSTLLPKHPQRFSGSRDRTTKRFAAVWASMTLAMANRLIETLAKVG
ncbi:MAG TPA: hypothetical protein VG167_18535 [Verrucomicrobiae bacterium]|nr:hypothetical protein [Verrucomicrobiae bacterium]